MPLGGCLCGLGHGCLEVNNMDCGTCEISSPLNLIQPEKVEAEVSITPVALERLSEAMGPQDALLVGVLSGGCSGYMYDLQVIEGKDPKCQELTVSGVRVLIPDAVSHLLHGIEIDYVEKLMGGGFKINNPNASASCGCGESFS